MISLMPDQGLHSSGHRHEPQLREKYKKDINIADQAQAGSTFLLKRIYLKNMAWEKMP